jgi:3-methyladenine DNA glycosylase Tag
MGIFEFMARDRTSGEKRAAGGGPDPNGAGQENSPYRYYIKGERPRADAAYFELLLAQVIHANGGIGNFDEVWPRAVQALAGFNIFRLAHLTGTEMNDAIASIGGGFSTRLAGKSDALITWAESFWRIRQVYGSFRQYVRSFDAEGFDALLGDMKQRLPGLSPDFLINFLREAGETTPTHTGQGRPAAGARGRRSRGERAATDESAGGNARRRGSRGGNAKASPPPKPANGTGKAGESGDAKSPGRSRRGRRRFFRRRSGRAKSNSST